MDNVTHTLIGVTVGHALARPLSKGAGISEEGSQRLQRAIFWASIFGNNFPDLDFVIRFFAEGDRLTYLLHHRGYTHTLLLSPAVAAAAAGVAILITRARLDWRIFFVGWLGTLLHFAADFCNDYGVHVLSPFDNRWFYGDATFLIEPTLWLGLLPFAFATARSKWARALCAVLGIGMLGAVWFTGAAPRLIAIGVTIWAAVFALLQLRGSWGVTPRRIALAGLAIFLPLVAFFMGSQEAKERIRAQLIEEAPQERLVQLATAPGPGDPFCWRVASASVDLSGTYIARLGAISLWPEQISADSCFYRLHAERIAPLEPNALPTRPDRYWVGEFRHPLSELERLVEQSCVAARFERFNRIPFWKSEPDGSAILGDLRYDNERSLGFAKFKVSPMDRCKAQIPEWTPPFLGQ
jgi:inner membrane protein